ncbi:MAG: acylneuraminate cytidylyltransferase family protein [Planctomycetota bacterium]
MTAAAIILGRAGSKGVPRKNLASIAGKPCVQWTIEHALASSRIEQVIVSSDSSELLELASSLGAIPCVRPEELASDSARVDDAARHAASRHAAEYYAILYANVPVRPEDLSDRAIDLLTTSGCDSVQSYARVGKHHPWWTCRINDDGAVTPWEGERLFNGVFRRQDLPPAFVPDGGVMALTADSLASGAGGGPHDFLGSERRGIETAEGDVVDIDTPLDLIVADAVLRERVGADR